MTSRSVSKLMLYKLPANAPLCHALCRKFTDQPASAEGIVSLARDYQPQGVAFVAISSNSIRTHPQDGPDQMAADAKQFGVRLNSVHADVYPG